MNLNPVSLLLIRKLEAICCSWCFVPRGDRSAIAVANVNLADTGDQEGRGKEVR